MAHQVKPWPLRIACRRRLELQPDHVAQLNEIGEWRVHKGRRIGFTGNGLLARAVAERADRRLDGVKVRLRPCHK